MNERAITAITVTLLMTSVSLLTFGFHAVRAYEIIYIRADGSIEPPTAPISRFDNGTYIITANIYDEIVVEKNNIVVDGAGYTIQGEGSGRGINLTGRSNVTIQNVKIKEFEYGISLLFSSTNTILGNNITANSRCGVYLEGSSNNTLAGNTFVNDGLVVAYTSYSSGNLVTDNFVNGKPLVYLEGVSGSIIDNAGQVILINCDGVHVENLDISNANIGVQLLWTSNIRLENNNINNNNGVGIRVIGSSINSMVGNKITNNNAGVELHFSDENYISQNNIANNNSTGLYLRHSSSNNIHENNVTKNEGHGVMLLFSSTNTIFGNNITDNGHSDTFDYGLGGRGILLNNSPGNHMSQNNIAANNKYGIRLYMSSTNTISGNNITAQGHGISLSDSSDNYIYHNNFANIHGQVYTRNSANVWDDGYPSGGNYWSNYDGVDLYSGRHQKLIGSDGIGDVPYVIDKHNKDNHPLIEPWTPLLLGDLNKDGIVDIFDVVTVAAAFGSKPDDSNWNPTADLIEDGTVDVFDVVLIAKNFGKKI